MSSQRRVSAKLHNELQSYSSLLRALRVQDIMDVTKQLKQKNPFALAPQNTRHEAGVDDLGSADDDDEMLSDFPSRLSSSPSVDLAPYFEQPVAGPSSSSMQSKKECAKVKGKGNSIDPTQKKRLRDNWTRWPLPVNDVLKPEWTLDDEVGFIVSQLLKTRPPSPDFPVSVAHPDDPHETGDLRAFAPRSLEFDQEDPDHPFYVPYITSVVSEYLSRLLALLASHMPARAAGMQNRIEPLNWRAVIDVVVSCREPEFSNTQIVSNVIERMEAIYGPSILDVEGRNATTYRAVERLKDKEKGQETFTKIFTSEISRFWQSEPLMIREDLKPEKKQVRVHRIRRHDEQEFRPRKSSRVAIASKSTLKAQDAAKKASKRKQAEEKKIRTGADQKENEVIPEPLSPVQPLPTPPQTQSEAGSSNQSHTSIRRSARPRRSAHSYELQSFLPPID